MTKDGTELPGGGADPADAAFEDVFRKGDAPVAPGAQAPGGEADHSVPQAGEPSGGGSDAGAPGPEAPGGEELPGGAPGGESPAPSGAQAPEGGEEMPGGAPGGAENDRMERTTLGRLQKERERNAALEKELAELKNKFGNGGQAAPPSGTVPAPALAESAIDGSAIPEDLRDDAEEFKADYPYLYPYLAMAGKRGEALRKALRESGPHTAAALATPIHQERLAERRSHDNYLDQVAASHPEVALFKDPSRLHEAALFRRGVEDWIETNPAFSYRDAVAKLRIVNGEGGPAALIGLLDDYKRHKVESVPQAKPPARPDPAREREAQAASAVMSRPGVPAGSMKPSASDDPNKAFEQVMNQKG